MAKIKVIARIYAGISKAGHGVVFFDPSTPGKDEPFPGPYMSAYGLILKRGKEQKLVQIVRGDETPEEAWNGPHAVGVL